MSLKNFDFDSAFRRLAEKRIEDAMKEGKFDNLPGFGQPIDLEPLPASEDARMMWWALRIMRQNDYTPDEVRLRKLIDTLKDELATATTERRVAALVTQINGVVKQVNTLGTNALKTAVAPISLERELHKLKERRGDPVENSSPAVSAPHREAVSTLASSDAAADLCQCSNPRCKNQNPTAALFCRCCGEALR